MSARRICTIYGPPRAAILKKFQSRGRICPKDLVL